MISVPQIQIRQTPGLIGIDADLGRQDIKQPRATFEMSVERPQQEIRQPAGELVIDQSRAWDALGKGPALETFNRIYSQAREVALQGIARIVENGNRMAQIHLKTNPIADIAEQLTFDFFEFNYVGEAAYDNVDIRYTARKPEIQVTDGRVNLTTHPNAPEYEYIRGKLDIYMQQYPQVEISVPQIDYKA
ncbi:hypothetical protein SAMN02799630_05255 [Paenibacillus sp. UNCCL117]|uniref:DUF6470 family protein n=1 Tax=unclassified Paenibacillus TaxID=185978 RepID=UPI0008903123|nr:MULTISPECIES: DUF6470 family protein [unclassified Paenibacillus]SDE35286.1 hypothetical protein SAMN04488602_125101 [Paenibacillus sp. cl123]SFW64484.1 hypothetical protein SAMN02799630_05255 [Paenibacillus sp. UNCCL117]